MAISKKLSILFWINRQKINSEGTAPIWARITLDGERSECSTGKRILPNHWNSDLNLPHKESPDATEITKHIIESKFSIQKHYQALQPPHYSNNFGKIL